MSKNNYYLNDAILGKILDKIIFLSKRKYSSNVIEKCLETCSREMVDKLIDIFSSGATVIIVNFGYLLVNGASEGYKMSGYEILEEN